MRGGMLKEKPIVRASRIEKRAKMGRGTGRAGPEPKVRAKERSLISPRPMFALEEG